MLNQRGRQQPAAQQDRELLGLWLPAQLTAAGPPAPNESVARAVDAGAAPIAVEGGPIEFDRVVPPSGNLMVCQRQFWLGPARAGQTVRFWASVDVIHLTIGGARVKSLRSHFSTADLAELTRQGATPAASFACTSQNTRSPSSSTTRRARSAAPRRARWSSSRAAAHDNRAQGQRQQNSLPAPTTEQFSTWVRSRRCASPAVAVGGVGRIDPCGGRFGTVQAGR
jgi:hypothetical protein